VEAAGDDGRAGQAAGLLLAVGVADDNFLLVDVVQHPEQQGLAADAAADGDHL